MSEVASVEEDMEESLISNRDGSRHTDLGRRIIDVHEIVSRSCKARFPADQGSLDAAAESLLV